MHTFLVLIFLFVFCQWGFSQNDHRSFIRINAESGYNDSYYFSDGTIQRLFLRIDQLHFFSSSQLKLNGSLIPEFLSLKQNIFNLKTNAGLNYSFLLFNIPLNLAGHVRYFKFNPESEPSQIFKESIFNFQINPVLSSDFFLLIKPGYFYRQLEADSDFRISYFSLWTGVVYQKDKKNQWQFIFIGERYRLNDYLNYKGNRIGPFFSYSYKGKFVFTISYKLLQNYPEADSLITFTENYFTIVVGYYFLPKVSLTLYANYIKINNGNQNTQQKNINRLQQQNEIYTKLAYDFNDKRNLYIKIAYQEDQYWINNIKLKSLQVLLGLEFKI